MKPLKGEHLGSVPEGHQIWADRLEVAGIQHRKASATRFVQGKGQRIEFEREPDNPHDSNAIRILGFWKSWFSEKSDHIGYMPRDVAQVIADLDVFDTIHPRLARTYLSRNGHVQVFFQFTGPKDGAKRFKQALSDAEGGTS